MMEKGTFRHLVSCKCGWRGAESKLKRGYVLVAPDDVTPMYRCPNCNITEDNCEFYEIKEAK